MRLGVAPAPSHHPSVIDPNGFAYPDSLQAWRPRGPGPTSLRPPIAHNGRPAGREYFTRCPSPTPSGLGLGPPHPQLISMAAEPSGIRWERFALSSRYSCRHSHSRPLQVAFPLPFSADRDAPLPLHSMQSAASATDLAPVDCRRHGTIDQ